MEEKKKNKGVIWLIIFLLVLVLGLVGFIVYDKVLLDSNSIDSNKENMTSTDEKENNKESSNEIKVVDATNFTSNYYNDDTIKFVLPKIINGGKNSEKLNKIILDTVLSNTVGPNDSNEESGNPKSLKTAYSYRKIENILIINVSTSLKPWNASGTGDFSYDFYYNINNDEILNEYDVLKNMGYSDSDIINKVGNCNYDTSCGMAEEDVNETCTIDKINTLFNNKYISLDITNKKSIKINWICPL